MGQYQQWLLHRSIDRQLRQELKTLEAELAQFESQLDSFFLAQCEREFPPLAENPILNALMYYAMAHTEPHQPEHEDDTGELEDQKISDQAGETISPALLNWDGTPDSTAQQAQHTPSTALSLSDSETDELLPDDILDFMDAHAQTDPQIELPRWLRKIAVASNTNDGTRPIDQESIRTNRLVQRWVERWGKQTPFSASPEQEHEGIPDA